MRLLYLKLIHCYLLKYMTTFFESLLLYSLGNIFVFQKYDDEGYPIYDDYSDEEEDMNDDLGDDDMDDDDMDDGFEDEEFDDGEWE